MRIEDLLFLDGWTWVGDIRSYTLNPGDEKVIVSLKGRKGYFYGAVAAFSGHDDARFGYLEVNIDDTFISPLYPYGMRLIGLDVWTPFGSFLLKYDTVADIYIVADIPNYLIPIRKKLEIKLGYPANVDTWFGTHKNTAQINAYVLYLYLVITDEKAFEKSYREFYFGE